MVDDLCTRGGLFDDLEATELPALEAAATVVRLGSPARAHRAAARIARWIEGHGYTLSGPNRELFVERPAPGQLDEAVIEMQFPVAATGSAIRRS